MLLPNGQPPQVPPAMATLTPARVFHSTFGIAFVGKDALPELVIPDHGDEPTQIMVITFSNGDMHYFPITGEQRKTITAMMNSGVVVEPTLPPELRGRT